MKLRIADLDGRLLDAAVAEAEKRIWSLESTGVSVTTSGATYSVPYRPSSNQEEGGEIIDREHIDCCYLGLADCWSAVMPSGFKARGPTRLIAAMRVFAESKLGPEVEFS